MYGNFFGKTAEYGAFSLINWRSSASRRVDSVDARELLLRGTGNVCSFTEVKIDPSTEIITPSAL